MRDSDIFDEAVGKLFKPIANNAKLVMNRLEDGVYEISSPYCVMFIRLNTGHKRGLNVILKSTRDENLADQAYGLGNFVMLEGRRLEEGIVETNSDFLQEAEKFANETKTIAIPHLLGLKDDFEAVKEMVKKQTEEDVKKIEEYRFPKNVRKEW